MPASRALETALRVARHRFAPLWLAAVGTCLFLPSLGSGLSLDDHLQRAVLTGSEAMRPLVGERAGMFGLAGFGGQAQTLQGLMVGVLPWWTSPDAQLNFWRPLSELTHRLDYRLFPDSPLLMHAHNLLWYFLLLLSAALLYRRFHAAPVVAGLCALLYACDDGHAFGASWIANRNGVITALFVVLTVYYHDRARRGGSQLSAVGAWLLTIPGLLSGEGYVAVLGYLFAHAIMLDRASALDRIRHLSPYLAAVLGWHAVYASLGYGSLGSAFYLDPGREPLLFAAKLFPRLSLLLGSHFGLGVPELAGFVPDATGKALALLHFVLLVLISWLVWPVLRTSATARFWALGAVLSAIPFCATLPMERNLLIPGLGAMGLVGKYLGDHLLRGGHQATRLVRVCAALLLFQHLVLAPLTKPAKALALHVMMENVDQCGEALAKLQRLEGSFAIALNASDGCTAYARVIGQLNGAALPLTLRTLSNGYGRTVVERIDDSTLRVRPDGGFFAIPFSRLFVDLRTPMKRGHVVNLPELSITVVDTTRDGRPAVIDVRFHRSLDSGRYRLLAASPGGLRVIQPPATRLVLPGRSAFSALLPAPASAEDDSYRAEQ